MARGSFSHQWTIPNRIELYNLALRKILHSTLQVKLLVSTRRKNSLPCKLFAAEGLRTAWCNVKEHQQVNECLEDGYQTPWISQSFKVWPTCHAYA